MNLEKYIANDFLKLKVSFQAYCRMHDLDFLIRGFDLCSMYFTNTWRVITDGAGNSIRINPDSDKKLRMYRDSVRHYCSDMYFKSHFSVIFDKASWITIMHNQFSGVEHLLCYILCNDKRLRAYDLLNHCNVMPLSAPLDVFIRALEIKEGIEYKKFKSKSWPGTTTIITFEKDQFQIDPIKCIDDDTIRQIFEKEIKYKTEQYGEIYK